jgi:hypothetical protein
VYSPKISDQLIPKIYKISKRLKRPMTAVVNKILEDALGNPDDRVQEPNAAYSSTTIQRKPPGKATKARLSNLVKCPLCENKYEVEEGEYLEFILKNRQRKKLYVCTNCYNKVQ